MYRLKPAVAVGLCRAVGLYFGPFIRVSISIFGCGAEAARRERSGVRREELRLGREVPGWRGWGWRGMAWNLEGAEKESYHLSHENDST